jgi:hypothetical protein
MKAEQHIYVLAPIQGKDIQQSAMYSYVSPEERFPQIIPSGRSRSPWCGSESTVPHRFERMYAATHASTADPEAKLARNVAAMSRNWPTAATC